jgi:hypothetical protein
MMRCRPGTVTHTAFATVPEQRCTASLSLALHRIRDTSDLILAPMGLDPKVYLLRKTLSRRRWIAPELGPARVPHYVKPGNDGGVAVADILRPCEREPL